MRRHVLYLVAVVVALSVCGREEALGETVSIADFGAVAANGTIGVAFGNAAAIEKAAAAVQFGGVVVIPPQVYVVAPVRVANLRGVTFSMAGAQLVWNVSIADWPILEGVRPDCFLLSNSSGVHMEGGTWDGQGYVWWEAALVAALGDTNRPHLFHAENVSGLTMHDNLWRNSPQYHNKLDDVVDVTIDGMEVWVDVEYQRSLLRRHGAWHEELSLPLFPLNTDGIDPRGRNVVIRNFRCRNFDDAVAVKPSALDGPFGCSENMVVDTAHVTYSVGMSIGSVPPHPGTNCIRNITIRNVFFDAPLKAIYVKPNPGDVGQGLIADVLYENIVGVDTLYWPIFLGPQQQHQPNPDKGDTSCAFLFPWEGTCPANPRVTMRDVTLRNVSMSGTLLRAGLVLCNETNPCEGFVFDDVRVSGGLSSEGYYCRNADVTVRGGSVPSAACGGGGL